METQNTNENKPSTPPPVDNQSVPASNDSKNMLMGILSYLGILLIIPLIMEKGNPTVKFHLKQGIVLLAIEIAIYILGMFLPYGMSMILSLLNLAVIVLSILGIINVIQKKEAELPVVGQFSKYVTFL